MQHRLYIKNDTNELEKHERGDEQQGRAKWGTWAGKKDDYKLLFINTVIERSDAGRRIWF